MIINWIKMFFRSALFFFLVLLFGCKVIVPGNDGIGISSDAKYPRWLISSSLDTVKQTSGIIFIGVKNNAKVFLIADDIGLIHHLTIKNDTDFTITPIHFSDSINNYLSVFPKKDFEEITYCKSDNTVYLSIEGNNPSPKEFTKILRLKFLNNDVFSDSVISISEVNFSPSSTFTKYVNNNIAYEGLAVDENYLYLGLEGFSEKNVFADSTIIFIVDKNNGKILKEISTKPYGISTVCGLFSDKKNSLYGVDRNSKLFFHLVLDKDLNVESFFKTKIPTSIPGYKNLDYVASLESISMDDENNIYFVDDPWTRYFVPDKLTLSKLDNSTISNFKSIVPVIYRFKINQ